MSYDPLAGPSVTSLAWSSITGKQSTYPPSAHTHPSSDVTDATTVGRALLTSANVGAQRTALGLGTAALSASTDFAGAVHTHAITDINASGSRTSSTYLRGDATWNTLPVPSWTLVQATSDQTVTNSTALTNSVLTFAMLANTKYRVRMTVWFDTTAAADFKYDVDQPASPTLIRTARQVVAPDGALLANLLNGIGLISATAVTSLLGTTGGYVEIKMIVHNGVNAGNWTFRFAQNSQVNDSGAILRAGSWLEYAVVS